MKMNKKNLLKFYYLKKLNKKIEERKKVKRWKIIDELKFYELSIMS